MSTKQAFLVRTTLIALIAGLGALVAAETIDTQAVLNAIYIALGAGATYAGIGAGTSIEPDVGRKA